MSIFSKFFKFNKNIQIDDVIYWQNITYAILTTCNNYNIKIVGGCKKTTINTKVTQKLLIEWWSINNRQDLLNMIEKLKNGLHNNFFLENINEVNIPYYRTKEEFILNEFKNFKQEAHPFLTMLYDVYNKNINYKNTPIIGWDLSRAVYLAHAGYVCGYVTYEEALDMGLEICKTLQNRFNSWEQMIFNYLDGYQFWSNELLSNPSSQAQQRLKVYNSLKNKKDSPYNLQWYLPLHKTW